MRKIVWMLVLIAAVVAMPFAAMAQTNRETSKSTSPSANGAMQNEQQQGETWGNQKGMEKGACADMRTMHQKMAKDFEAMDSKLDQKTSAMDKAKGQQEKVDAMAAVIDEMVAQRKTMRDDFSSFHTARMECMKMHHENGTMHHGTKKGNEGETGYSPSAESM